MDNIRHRGGTRAPVNNRSHPRNKITPKSKRAAVKQPRERLAKFDIPFFIIILILSVFGLVMLLSASSSFAAREFGNSHHFFNNQLGFAVAGLAVMIVVSFVPYRIFLDRRILTLVIVGSIVMMIAVFTPLGVTQGGARRWLGLAGITFQPSEVMKFALIVVLGYIVHKHPEYLKNHRRGFSGFFLFGIIIGLACILTVTQRHLSGTIIMFAIGVTLMFVSPVRTKYVAIAIGVLILGVVIAPPILESVGFNHFEARLLSWRNPEADITDRTFQTYQSLVTIGSGGWFGLGLGNSRQKFSYLPATHNDFVFSVICEELGFVGGVLVLILFVVFILRGFYIAAHARDRFGMMLATGISAQIGIQAFLNIAVVTNSVPNTGITLPFFSYGGTAIVMLMAQLGVLLNISRKAAIK